MAQVSFAKLAPKASTEVATINFNDQEIEVKQYLPIDQKLEGLTNILNSCADDMGYYNPAKVNVFITLETVFRYTNIKFTDKQKEDPKKLYDQLIGSGLYEKILEAMSDSERYWFEIYVQDSMNQIYKYRDSIYGILDAMKTDYSDLNLDVEGLRNKLADAEGLSTVKEVLDKLG
jgi:hypothetical protein